MVQATSGVMKLIKEIRIAVVLTSFAISVFFQVC